VKTAKERHCSCGRLIRIPKGPARTPCRSNLQVEFRANHERNTDRRIAILPGAAAASDCSGLQPENFNKLCVQKQWYLRYVHHCSAPGFHLDDGPQRRCDSMGLLCQLMGRHQRAFRQQRAPLFGRGRPCKTVGDTTGSCETT